jgi:hypothetical protein
MSFVSDTLLSGGARLHVARGEHQGNDAGKRSSQSQGGRLDPLIRLVKDPFGLLGGGRDADENAQKVNEEEEDRKQLLRLRMRDVSVGTCLRFHMLTVPIGRVLRRLESRCGRVGYPRRQRCLETRGRIV